MIGFAPGIEKMPTHLFACIARVAALLTALASCVAIAGCDQADEAYVGSAELRLTSVVRESDGTKLYDGCVVVRAGAPIPAFAAAAGDLLSEQVRVVDVDKRSQKYNPAMDDLTNDAYWCSSTDNYGKGSPGSVGLADCYRAAGADPPAVIQSASLTFDTSMTVPISVTRVLEVRHSGTLTLVPNPPCSSPGLPPPQVDELTILE